MKAGEQDSRDFLREEGLVRGHGADGFDQIGWRIAFSNITFCAGLEDLVNDVSEKEALKMTISVAGEIFLIWLTTSSPLSSGMVKSSTTTSGGGRRRQPQPRAHWWPCRKYPSQASARGAREAFANHGVIIRDENANGASHHGLDSSV